MTFRHHMSFVHHLNPDTFQQGISGGGGVPQMLKGIKIGTRLSVYWKLDKIWYTGHILESKQGKHLIKYEDDGMEEWLSLQNETLRMEKMDVDEREEETTMVVSQDPPPPCHCHRRERGGARQSKLHGTRSVPSWRVFRSHNTRTRWRVPMKRTKEMLLLMLA